MKDYSDKSFLDSFLEKASEDEVDQAFIKMKLSEARRMLRKFSDNPAFARAVGKALHLAQS